ncbi:MAG: pyridoxal-phosphate dependent enzyme, partial [Planctomycetota bacterium]
MITLTTDITPEAIFREAMLARPRLATVDEVTPIDAIALANGGTALIKREDRSRVNSFKWRGATNRIAVMHERGESGPIVAASAGNHAQGVAIAAARFGLRATIFMPRNTPRIKVGRVRELGGEWVEVELVGDSYDEAAAAAQLLVEKTGGSWVHPFDDPLVIAGQGVIGDEIVHQLKAPPARVYLCVGGGGLAAGVAAVLRAHWPGIELIGVEAEGQASMTAAIRNGEPVDIGEVDTFCDGSAVRIAGKNTYQLCTQLLDRMVTVTNDQVCAAIECAWRVLRAVPEPSGALGLAGLLNDSCDHRDGSLAILSGSNLDFMTLPKIARRSHIGTRIRRHFAFGMGEHPGALVSLLERIGDGCNIVDFQYGKSDHRFRFIPIG